MEDKTFKEHVYGWAKIVVAVLAWLAGYVVLTVLLKLASQAHPVATGVGIGVFIVLFVVYVVLLFTTKLPLTVYSVRAWRERRAALAAETK